MLESSDHGSSSLDSVMTSSNSPCKGTPRDSHQCFASQHNSPLQESSFLPSFASSRQQLATPTSSDAQMPEWPYARDETWVFEPSRRTSGECLADFNFAEVDTPRSSDPFGDRDDDLLTWAVSQEPSMSVVSNRWKQRFRPGTRARAYMVAVSSFLFVRQDLKDKFLQYSPPRRRTFGQEVRSLMHQESLGGYGAIPAIEENMEESTTSPSFNLMESFMSQAESMIGTSEETTGDHLEFRNSNHQTIEFVSPRKRITNWSCIWQRPLEFSRSSRDVRR